MKKLIAITALFCLVFTGLSAQEKKAWLFYDGLSEETIANLTADKTNWADNGTDAEGNVNNWKNAVKQSADAYWMANGQVIEELRGLKIDIGSNKDNSVHLATTKLRLTRKSTKITFPKLANGQKITIQGRSAKKEANDRGIAPVQNYIKFLESESSPLYGGKCIFVGADVEGSEGTYTFVWQVQTSETDSVDVQFQLTPDAGIDFTYFMIDNGDAPGTEEARNVAYVYSGDNSLDSDYAYIYLLGAGERFTLTEINADNTVATTDSLRNFGAVVISPTVAADNRYVPTLKETVAFVPMLNLNPGLYSAMGYGEAVKTETGTLTVTDPDNIAFTGLDTTGGIELLPGGSITGVKLGSYFANDNIVAKAGDVVAMHMHNAKRNAYMLLPLSMEDMEAYDQDILSIIIPEALQAVANTKAEVKAVSTPTISVKEENGKSTVTLSAANSNAIYYTTNGADPTTASTLYTAPFTLTSNATVKAFAVGDGYTDSNIAEKQVLVKVNAAAPAINVNRAQGKSTITISCSTPGAKVYFNFNGVHTPELSQAYTDEPIVLTEPAKIYALAVADGYLQSDISEQYVGINGIDAQTIRLDVLSHFDANQTDWLVDNSGNGGTGDAGAYYYWGKSSWNYYSEDVDHTETTKDSNGNDSTYNVYKPNPESEKVIYPVNDNGWVLKSAGQVLTGELTLKPDGGGVGNGATGRFVEEAVDYIGTITTGVITFGDKKSGEPYTGRIESTKKYAGPFDVVVYCGNGNGSGKANMEIQTSKDGETWETVAPLKLADTQRYIKRTRASYEGTDEVYVRVAQVGGSSKAQVYDIYLLNHGEESKKYNEDTAAGIQNIEQTVNRKAAIYNINGVRMQQMQRGLNIVVGADGKVRKIMVK